MNVQQSLYVVLLVGVLLASGVEGLECYSCTNCAGNFLSNSKSCPAQTILGVGIPARCMKLVTGSEITRSCTVSPVNGCASLVVGGVTTTTCFCDTDLCNSSRRIHGSVLIASVLSMIVAKFFM